MRGRSFRLITLLRFQQSEPYARAKSWILRNWSALFSTMYSLWSRPARLFVSTRRVSPVVPGLSGSKKSRITSARSAYHLTTPSKSYPRSRELSMPSALSLLTGESIMPGESTIMNSEVASSVRSFSIVWCTSPGPYCRSPEKPMSGSPIRLGPSRSLSSPGAGAITVNASSVGATPAVCTGRRST